MPIFGNKNIDVHLGGTRDQKEKKDYGFHFRLQLNLHFYFHATGSLLEYFEIFDNFDIFTLLLSLVRPLKVGTTPLGQKFEL